MACQPSSLVNNPIVVDEIHGEIDTRLRYENFGKERLNSHSLRLGLKLFQATEMLNDRVTIRVDRRIAVTPNLRAMLEN